MLATQGAIAAGEQLELVVTMGPIADIDINVLSVTTKTVEVNGVEMEIGCAQILKTVPLTIDVLSVGPPTMPSPVQLVPITIETTLQFLESAGLCFPEGFTTDNITTHVRSAEVISLTALPVNGEFLLHKPSIPAPKIIPDNKIYSQKEFSKAMNNGKVQMSSMLKSKLTEKE